jgi:hypothetical protein
MKISSFFTFKNWHPDFGLCQPPIGKQKRKRKGKRKRKEEIEKGKSRHF